jgi:hypothetical protein
VTPLPREAGAAARSQPVASVLTLLLVAGMIVAVIRTTGRTVGAEQDVLHSIDSVGTRTVTIRADQDAGVTNSALRTPRWQTTTSCSPSVRTSPSSASTSMSRSCDAHWTRSLWTTPSSRPAPRRGARSPTRSRPGTPTPTTRTDAFADRQPAAEQPVATSNSAESPPGHRTDASAGQLPASGAAADPARYPGPGVARSRLAEVSRAAAGEQAARHVSDSLARPERRASHAEMAARWY